MITPTSTAVRTTPQRRQDVPRPEQCAPAQLEAHSCGLPRPRLEHRCERHAYQRLGGKLSRTTLSHPLRLLTPPASNLKWRLTHPQAPGETISTEEADDNIFGLASSMIIPPRHPEVGVRAAGPFLGKNFGSKVRGRDARR